MNSETVSKLRLSPKTQPAGNFQTISEMFKRLFRKVRIDPGSDLTTEYTEETQIHTEKKEEKGSERALTRISRKTRKDANEFLKFQNLFEQSVFHCFLC